MLNYKKEAKRPFKVFMSEEEWQNAVLDEIEKMQNANPSEDEVLSVKERIIAEAEALKREVPGFDLKQMLESDPEFRDRVLKGYSIEEAFYLSNRKKNATAPAKKKVGMRENGRSNSMGAGSTKNVASMSDEEFKKYINSIKGSRL